MGQAPKNHSDVLFALSAHACRVVCARSTRRRASGYSMRRNLGRYSLPRPQRIRDPIHDLIEFNTGEFEQMCWRLVQTAAFQRLRRIKQLAFSELVYTQSIDRMN